MRGALEHARRALSRLCGAEASAAGCLQARRIRMSVQSIAPEARPRLPRGVRLIYSEAHGGWVLAAPERIFRTNPTALEILKRCDGSATFGDIIDDLTMVFDAPRE